MDSLLITKIINCKTNIKIRQEVEVFFGVKEFVGMDEFICVNVIFTLGDRKWFYLVWPMAIVKTLKTLAVNAPAKKKKRKKL